MKIALIFLVFIIGVATIRFASVIDREKISSLFTNPFVKKEIVKPLALEDPLSEITDLLREKNIDVSQSPQSSDSAILVTLAGTNTIVVFSAEKEKTTQVGSLQIILNKLTMDGRKAKKIDLRFDTPLVVY